VAVAEILKGNPKYLGARIRVRVRLKGTLPPTTDVVRKLKCKHFGGKIRVRLGLGGRRHRRPTTVGIRKLECFCYLTVKTA